MTSEILNNGGRPEWYISLLEKYPDLENRVRVEFYDLDKMIDEEILRKYFNIEEESLAEKNPKWTMHIFSSKNGNKKREMMIGSSPYSDLSADQLSGPTQVLESFGKYLKKNMIPGSYTAVLNASPIRFDIVSSPEFKTLTNVFKSYFQGKKNRNAESIHSDIYAFAPNRQNILGRSILKISGTSFRNPGGYKNNILFESPNTNKLTNRYVATKVNNVWKFLRSNTPKFSYPEGVNDPILDGRSDLVKGLIRGVILAEAQRSAIDIPEES